MRDGPNLTRRADLKSALRRAKPADNLTLEALAIIWGTTKSRFVSVRNTMPDFPQPMAGQGNGYIYPAAKALKAMLAHETRHDDAAKARAARTNAILGRSGRKGDAADVGAHTPSELATLSRMAAEAEQRERDQGMYVPVAEQAAIAGDVFSEISEFMRGLSNKLDPHGLLPPETRTLVDTLGDELLLRIHRKMKDVLSPDAKPRANRTATRRTRKA